MKYFSYLKPEDNFSNILAIIFLFNWVDLENCFCHPVAVNGGVTWQSLPAPVKAGKQYTKRGTGVFGND